MIIIRIKYLVYSFYAAVKWKFCVYDVRYTVHAYFKLRSNSPKRQDVAKKRQNHTDDIGSW